jgi:DNA-binding HxlR family transcriptional regulator
MKMRGNCPVSYGLDLFGDRWTLLIVRDLVVKNKRSYREFLSSPEGIATNILSDRLKRLVEADLATKEEDPENKSQGIYTPTKKAIALLPVLLEMTKWSLAYGPKSLRLPAGM